MCCLRKYARKLQSSVLTYLTFKISLICVAYFPAGAAKSIQVSNFLNKFYVYYPIASKLSEMICMLLVIHTHFIRSEVSPKERCKLLSKIELPSSKI